MKPKHVVLERGRALLIVGPQGCGKSALAREIAKLHGRYIEICNSAFGNPRDIGSVLDNIPAVIIVADGLPTQARRLTEVWSLLLFSEVLSGSRCGNQREPNKAVLTPHFIFTQQSEAGLPQDMAHLFRVLRMTSREDWSLS